MGNIKTGYMGNIWEAYGIHGYILKNIGLYRKYQNGIYGKYLRSIWDTWIYLEKYGII